MRSRSVDFAALRANTAAFGAMRASLDMTTKDPCKVGAHYYSHNGSLATPSARASVDICPPSSFCMYGPV